MDWKRHCTAPVTARISYTVEDQNYIETQGAFCPNNAVPGQRYCISHGGAAPDSGSDSPKVVTLCGSTRFWEDFRDVGLELTLSGVIVLSIGVTAPDSMVLANPDTDKGRDQKRRLDLLHKKKIEMSDEILVLNRGGYIGDSTKSEIQHAVKMGVPVFWLFPEENTTL